LAGYFHRGPAVLRFQAAVALALEQLPQRQADVAIVFGDQNIKGSD
jgi:hypothetical protein